MEFHNYVIIVLIIFIMMTMKHDEMDVDETIAMMETGSDAMSMDEMMVSQPAPSRRCQGTHDRGRYPGEQAVDPKANFSPGEQCEANFDPGEQCETFDRVVNNSNNLS